MPRLHAPCDDDRLERLSVSLPISVYLGWITIATVADISATLVSLHWDGFGISAETWAVVISLLVLVIAVLMAAKRRDVTYELVVIWAFVGIAVNQSSNQTIVALMLAGIVIVAIATAANILLARRRPAGGVTS